MGKIDELKKSIDENDKLIEDLTKMLWLLSKHIDEGTPRVKAVYKGVQNEIQEKHLIRERLKEALAVSMLEEKGRLK